MVVVAAAVFALPFVVHAKINDTGWSEARTRALAADVVPVLDDLVGPVLLEIPSPVGAASWLGPGLMVELQEAGVPFVVDDPVLERQLGSWRSLDENHAVARLIVCTCEIHGQRRGPSHTARLVAEVDGISAAEAAEMQQLRHELRAVFAELERLPVRDELPRTPDVPGLEEVIADLVDRVDDLDGSPDQLLDSQELVSLIGLLDLVFDGIDPVIDVDLVPADDLVRYAQLRAWSADRSAAVYIDKV
jgi:hypothetical protein